MPYKIQKPRGYEVSEGKRKLKTLMESRGISVVAMARTLDIKRETMTRKIAGTQPFYLREVTKMHKAHFSDMDLIDFIAVFDEYE